MNKSILIRLTGISILLAAVFYAVVIVYFGKEEKSAENRTIGARLYSDGKFLETYMDVYKKKYGIYPSAEQGLSALAEKPSVGKIPNNYKSIVSQKSQLLDPWGNPYRLVFDSKGGYGILSLGKDGKEGGNGMNRDFNILDAKDFPPEYTPALRPN